MLQGGHLRSLHCYGHFRTATIIKLLLARGAEVSAKSICDRTALNVASSDDHIEIFKLLLEHGTAEAEGSGTEENKEDVMVQAEDDE